MSSPYQNDQLYEKKDMYEADAQWRSIQGSYESSKILVITKRIWSSEEDLTSINFMAQVLWMVCYTSNDSEKKGYAAKRVSEGEVFISNLTVDFFMDPLNKHKIFVKRVLVVVSKEVTHVQVVGWKIEMLVKAKTTANLILFGSDIVEIMARDLLTPPASTVASESCFSLSGRILSKKRSRLAPDILDALVCSKDWNDARKRRQEFNDEYEEVSQGSMVKLSPEAQHGTARE
ncbi:hypothetical protein C5167_048428 [Papaver somniferum]|uniref:HAT C-terminal dimerisation domain-containing protein n=1 Tax=Papaver somniferum TaxID=3469 RepID=A0A4Y7KLI4_PAPSO|nr:hypothetical protein C5167_048428 [Papaver somniferum]